MKSIKQIVLLFCSLVLCMSALSGCGKSGTKTTNLSWEEFLMPNDNQLVFKDIEWKTKASDVVDYFKKKNIELNYSEEADIAMVWDVTNITLDNQPINWIRCVFVDSELYSFSLRLGPYTDIERRTYEETLIKEIQTFVSDDIKEILSKVNYGTKDNFGWSFDQIKNVGFEIWKDDTVVSNEEGYYIECQISLPRLLQSN